MENQPSSEPTKDVVPKTDPPIATTDDDLQDDSYASWKEYIIYGHSC